MSVQGGWERNAGAVRRARLEPKFRRQPDSGGGGGQAVHGCLRRRPAEEGLSPLQGRALGSRAFQRPAISAVNCRPSPVGEGEHGTALVTGQGARRAPLRPTGTRPRGRTSVSVLTVLGGYRRPQVQANKDRLQAPATSSSLKVACGKKATSSAHQVDGRTYTFALQGGFTRLPRFTSNLDCQSETKAYSSDQFRSCRGERPLWLQDWIRASGAKHGNSFCTALIHRSRFGPAEAALRSEAAQRSEDGRNHVRRGQRRIGLAFKTGIQDFCLRLSQNGYRKGGRGQAKHR